MRKAFAGIAVLAMASLVLAAGRPGVVKLKDGRLFDGIVDEQTDSVTVTVRGIDTSLARGDIDSITYGTFEQRWVAGYEKLPKDDAKAHIAAGRRAFDEHRYDLAERALRQALAIDPNNAEAAELLRLTQNQSKMEKATGTGGNGSDGGTALPPGGVRPPGEPAETNRPGAWKTLTNEQVNQIKHVEFNANDDKLRVNFKNNVVNRYVEGNPNEEARTVANFKKLSQAEQAARIIKHGGPDLAKDVEIVNDPAIVMTFRRDVLPVVLQNCATSACHGGNNDGSAKFGLVSPAADQASIYTNFYVLQTYKQKAANQGDGIFTPTVNFMINRSHPEKSLLLQYGMPLKENVELKHPAVKGFTPLFPRGANEAKYATIKNFISTLNRLEPEYGIDFKLERQNAAATNENPPPAPEPVPAPATAPVAPAGAGTAPVAPGGRR